MYRNGAFGSVGHLAVKIGLQFFVEMGQHSNAIIFDNVILALTAIALGFCKFQLLFSPAMVNNFEKNDGPVG